MPPRDELRQLSDDELYDMLAKYGRRTWEHHRAEGEPRRRNDRGASRRSWIAIVVSRLAFLVSLAALLKDVW
jgi:hypothetical protein